VDGNPIKPPQSWIWGFGCNDAGAVWTISPPDPPQNPGSQPITDGTTVEIAYVVDIAEPITDQHKLVNNSYQIISFDPPGSDSGPPVTTTVNAPNWVITKTASSSTIQPTEYVTYTITVINSGHLDTSGTYIITEEIPANTDPVTADAPEAVRTGSTLTWTFSDSLAKLVGSRSMTYAVRVNSPLPGGTAIVNDEYTVSGGNAVGPVTGDPVTVTVDSPVTLSISKQASPEPAPVAELINYTLTVTNNTATGPAEGVVITDILPLEVTYQSAGFLDGVNGFVDDSADPTIVWVLTDTIAPNDSIRTTLTARVDGAPLPNPPFITNTFQTSASNAPQASGSLATELAAGDPVTLTVTTDDVSLQVCETTIATALLVDQWNNPVPGQSLSLSAVNVSGVSEVLQPSSGTTNDNGRFTATLKALGAGEVRVFGSWLNLIIKVSLPITITEPSIPDQIDVRVMPASIDVGGETAVVTAEVTDCKSPAEPKSGQFVSFSLSDLSLATFSGPTTGSTDSTGFVTTTVVSTLDDELSGTVKITGTSGSLVDVENLTIGNPTMPVFVPIILKQAQ
jgi:uncharacterized repeat protein (TIGR01451 family)